VKVTECSGGGVVSQDFAFDVGQKESGGYIVPKKEEVGGRN